MDWIKSQDGVEVIILSSQFAIVNGRDIVTEYGQINKLVNNMRVQSALIETVNKIRALGVLVIIVSPTPYSSRNNGLCLARAELFGEMSKICDFPLDDDSISFAFLRSVNEHIPIYWLTDAMCTRGICDTARGDIFLYRDGMHLSKEGSAHLGKIFHWMEQFRAIAR